MWTAAAAVSKQRTQLCLAGESQDPTTPSRSGPWLGAQPTSRQVQVYPAYRRPLRAELRVLDARPQLTPFRIGACIKRASLESALVEAFWGSIAEA
jgi:hypothetical protein